MSKIKDFIDELLNYIREEGKSVFVESDVTYLEVEQGDDKLTLWVEVWYREEMYYFDFKVEKLPRGITVWSEARVRQRVREELSILLRALQQGDTDITDGVLEYVG